MASLFNCKSARSIGSQKVASTAYARMLRRIRRLLVVMSAKPRWLESVSNVKYSSDDVQVVMTVDMTANPELDKTLTLGASCNIGKKKDSVHSSWCSPKMLNLRFSKLGNTREDWCSVSSNVQPCSGWWTIRTLKPQTLKPEVGISQPTD